MVRSGAHVESRHFGGLMSGADSSPVFRMAAAISLAAVAAIAAVRVAAAPLPTPGVSGPIKTSVALGDASHDYPYSSTVDDLAKFSYVEEEYFVEGAANRYTTPPMATGTIVDSGHPYKTRVLVRRPASPA